MSSTSVTPLDPLQLRTKLIGEEGVQAVRNRKSPAGLLGKFKARGKREKVAEFYEGQDEVSGITLSDTCVEVVRARGKKERGEEGKGNECGCAHAGKASHIIRIGRAQITDQL